MIGGAIGRNCDWLAPFVAELRFCNNHGQVFAAWPLQIIVVGSLQRVAHSAGRALLLASV